MKHANLAIAGSESHQVQRNQLSLVAMPAATDTYCPVRHDVVVDSFQDAFDNAGFQFGGEVHHLTRNGKRYFGMFELLHDGMNEQHALVAGIRNSLDMAFALTLLIGGQVFICDNLQFSAANVMKRKHTTHILRDLPGILTDMVSTTGIESKVLDARYDQYQQVWLTDSEADRLMVSMVRQGAVNTSRIGKVIQEWYEPTATNDDGVLLDHGPKKVWRLLNAATEALKGAPIHDMPERTLRLQSILDDAAGFDPKFMQGRLVA
jgi:hypothetical protein